MRHSSRRDNEMIVKLRLLKVRDNQMTFWGKRAPGRQSWNVSKVFKWTGYGEGWHELTWPCAKFPPPSRICHCAFQQANSPLCESFLPSKRMGKVLQDRWYFWGHNVSIRRPGKTDEHSDLFYWVKKISSNHWKHIFIFGNRFLWENIRVRHRYLSNSHTG